MNTLQTPIEKLRERIAKNQFSDFEPNRICWCGECDGYGHIFTEHGAYRCPNVNRYTVPKQVRKEMDNQRWEGWPPASFESWRAFPTFVNTNSFREAEIMVQVAIGESKEPHGLILCGGHGRGKTLAGLMAIRAFAENGDYASGIRFPEMIAEYRRGISGDGFVKRVFQRLRSSIFFLVDDFGREAKIGNPEIVQSAISAITDECYRKRFLILTSNLTAKELSEAFPTDVISRLRDGAGYSRIIEEPFGQDLRGKI